MNKPLLTLFFLGLFLMQFSQNQIDENIYYLISKEQIDSFKNSTDSLYKSYITDTTLNPLFIANIKRLKLSANSIVNSKIFYQNESKSFFTKYFVPSAGWLVAILVVIVGYFLNNSSNIQQRKATKQDKIETIIIEVKSKIRKEFSLFRSNLNEYNKIHITSYNLDVPNFNNINEIIKTMLKEHDRICLTLNDSEILSEKYFDLINYFKNNGNHLQDKITALLDKLCLELNSENFENYKSTLSILNEVKMENYTSLDLNVFTENGKF